MSRYSAGPNLLQISAYLAPLAPFFFYYQLYGHQPYVPGALEVLLFWAWALGLEYAMIALHEAGHAVVGWILGIRPEAVQIGHWRKLFSFRLGSVPIVVRAAPASGQVSMHASPEYFSLWRFTPMILAGLGAEMALLVGLYRGGGVWEVRSFSASIAAFSQCVLYTTGTLHLLFNLLPAEFEVGGELWRNDGLQLVNRWKKRGEWKRNAECQREWQPIAELINAGRHAEARERLGDLLARHPDLPALRDVLAMLHTECGDTHQAEALLRARLKEPGQTRLVLAEILDHLCCLSLYHGRLDLLPEADAWSNEALNYAPQAVTLWGTRGSLLIELGRIDEGVELLLKTQERTECDLDRAISAAYLAKAAYARGDAALAAEWLREAERMNASHAVVKRIAAQLKPASAHP